MTRYDAHWHSLDKRPLPLWYDHDKIGILVHWGVYSVPGFSDMFWWKWIKEKHQSHIDFMRRNYPPNFTYQDFAPELRGEFFDPHHWVDIFKKSGAKYVILTSKHYDGYALWPSTYSFSWNSVDVGPRRDVVGDLEKAVRAKHLKFGIYYSLHEWFHPLYLKDKDNDWGSCDFVDKKVIPEIVELIEAYKPDILWSDGAWEASSTYWKSKQLLAWLYNESPVKDNIIINDRWGMETPCKHGGFFTCQDHFNPGHLMPRKWENVMSIDSVSWGYRRNIGVFEIIRPKQLIRELIQTVSCGGNILINIGITKEGTIIPIFQERLLQLGEWLDINGEAIYETVPWIYQKDSWTPDVWYTSKGNVVYVLVPFWPNDNVLDLEAIKILFKTVAPTVTMLGNDNLELPTAFDGVKVRIHFPTKEISRGKWVYAVKICPKE